MACSPLYCICGVTLPQRVVICILCLLGVIVAYGQRCNLTMSITRMISHEIRNQSHSSCPFPNVTLHETKIRGGDVHWSEFQQEVVLSAFFLGYFLFQVPGGILADHFGGRYVYAIGLLISSALCLVSPLVVLNFPYYLVALLRVFTGLAQAVIYPCMSTLVTRWIPAQERGILGGFSFGSNSLGLTCGNLFSGFLMDYTANWNYVFYFWGLLGLLWSLCFLLYVYSGPEDHPHLTEKERLFLNQTLVPAKKMKTPWKEIMVDRGIVALIVGQMGNDFTLFLIMTNFPKYLSDVLRYDVKSTALITSLPFLLLWLSAILSGRVIDHLIKVKHYDVGLVRRVATYFAFVFPNSFIVLMVYMECNLTLVTVMYTLAIFTKGPHYPGFKVNHMDISINFNGVIMAIINGFGAIGGFAPSYVIAWIAPNNTLFQWKIVIWITWFMGFIFTTYYLIFGMGRRAKWDVPPEELDQWTKENDEMLAEKAKKKAEKLERKNRT